LNETQNKLERVEAALAAYGGGRRGGGRSAGHGASPRTRSRKRRGGRKKGSTHSAATKRKISQAMKKRWAERKKGE
jgi:hypothetical protein